MPYGDPLGIYYHPGGSRGPAAGIVRGAVRYASTIDPAITNLYAHYGYDNRKTLLPVVVLMHGYDQDASTMTSAIMQDMASYGLFALAVGMRGRNGAGGTRDTSARELYDIVDAVEYIKTKFSAYIDTSNINVVGYSGGGGNAFGLAAKFPDYFNVFVSHFGISDYGYDPSNSWWALNPSRQSSIEQWIGGTPAAKQAAYYSRAHQYGIGKNLQGGYLFMFHDDQDTNVQIVQSNMVKAQLDSSSRTNYNLNISTTASSTRWIHASPDANQPVRLSRLIWGPPIKAKTYPQWSFPDSGTVMVQGYIVTKKFSIWLGNGTEKAANVTYNVTSNSYTVTPLSGSTDITIKQGAKTGSATGITSQTTITVS